MAREAVVANVTPTQLYGRLLANAPLPDAASAAPRRFRYGRAEMHIHMALAERPRWEGDERLGQTALLHLTPGLDGVSRAVNEADRGLLPVEGTIACGQPMAVDPSRAPEGSWILWLQMQELPSHVKGDAAGEIDVGDGTWTPELRERYADRIQARLRAHIPNLESALRKRVVLSPADLEGANINLVGGDIYSRLLRARPEPRLAPAAEPARAPHPDRRPLPRRREHSPRPRPRCRLGNARGQGHLAPEPRSSRSRRGALLKGESR